MQTVNMHEAKTHLSRLVEKASKGEPFIIARIEPHLPRRTLLDQGYLELAITGEHGASVGVLPMHHKDPFDQLLVAQAMVEGITLLTVDATLAQYGGVVRRV